MPSKALQSSAAIALVAAAIGGAISIATQVQAANASAHEATVTRRAQAYADFAVAFSHLEDLVLTWGIVSPTTPDDPLRHPGQVPGEIATVDQVKALGKALDADVENLDEAAARVQVLASTHVADLARTAVGGSRDVKQSLIAWEEHPDTSSSRTHFEDTVNTLWDQITAVIVASQRELADPGGGFRITPGWVLAVLLLLSILVVEWIRRVNARTSQILTANTQTTPEETT